MGLLIVFQSTTGGAKALAEAAYEGALTAQCAPVDTADANSGSDAVRLLRADEAGPDDLIAASGYLFACPENLAAIAGLMKDFFDRSYYPVLGRLEGRPYGQIICAGTDGTNAAKQIARIATGWRLKAIDDPLIVRTNADTPEAIMAPKTISAHDRARAQSLGGTLAAGLELGIF